MSYSEASTLTHVVFIALNFFNLIMTKTAKAKAAICSSIFLVCQLILFLQYKTISTVNLIFAIFMAFVLLLCFFDE